MPEDKTYLSNGVQTGSVVKSYLLTGKGEMPVKGQSRYRIHRQRPPVCKLPKEKKWSTERRCNRLAEYMRTELVPGSTIALPEICTRHLLEKYLLYPHILKMK